MFLKALIMLQRSYYSAPDVLHKWFNYVTEVLFYAPIMLQRCFINGILAWLNVMFSILYALKII
jgi:hypothetical protein